MGLASCYLNCGTGAGVLREGTLGAGLKIDWSSLTAGLPRRPGFPGWGPAARGAPGECPSGEEEGQSSAGLGVLVSRRDLLEDRARSSEGGVPRGQIGKPGVRWKEGGWCRNVERERQWSRGNRERRRGRKGVKSRGEGESENDKRPDLSRVGVGRKMEK